MKIETKKLVTLYLTFIFGVLSVMASLENKPIPSEFTTTVGMILAYYFGKGGNANVSNNDKDSKL